jgi:hypothetical protein
MRLGLTLFPPFIWFGLLYMHGLSNSDLISYVNSLDYDDNENPGKSNQPIRTFIPQSPIDNTQVEIVKSFKNSSGFYKINGTIENQESIILTDIQVIKYYKIPSVNDTTLVCYEQNIIKCEYTSIDNQLPSKSFFLNMPPAPPSEPSIKPN